MLANPIYAGRIRADGEVVKAAHEGIVDEKTFDLVQQKLQANARNAGTERRPKRDPLLRGILYCASCGGQMAATYASSKHRQYRYYACPQSTQRRADACVTRSVSAPVVENAVLESVKRFATTPEVLEVAASAARLRLMAELDQQRKELKEVNIILRNARSQLARAGSKDPGREAMLRDKIDAAQRKADGLRESVTRGERLRLDDETVGQRLRNFEEVWKVMAIEEQSRLLRTLIERVGYDGRRESVRITYHSNGVRELCKGVA